LQLTICGRGSLQKVVIIVMTGLLYVEGVVADVRQNRDLEAFWDFVGCILSKTSIGL